MQLSLLQQSLSWIIGWGIYQWRTEDVKEVCTTVRSVRVWLDGENGPQMNIALLQQLPFVVGTGSKIIRAPSQSVRVAFIQVVDQLLIILNMIHKREVTEPELNILHGAAKQIGPLLKKACEGLPTEFRSQISLNRPKVHALLHFRCTLILVLYLFSYLPVY